MLSKQQKSLKSSQETVVKDEMQPLDDKSHRLSTSLLKTSSGRVDCFSLVKLDEDGSSWNTAVAYKDKEVRRTFQVSVSKPIDRFTLNSVIVIACSTNPSCDTVHRCGTLLRFELRVSVYEQHHCIHHHASAQLYGVSA